MKRLITPILIVIFADDLDSSERSARMMAGLVNMQAAWPFFQRPLKFTSTS